MAIRPVEIGPTGKTVAERIKDLRKQRQMQQSDLARRMTELGRPMAASAISKIETGERRVDVDDLMAFAVALDTPPHRLLMPETESPFAAVVLPGYTESAEYAWRWLLGEWPVGEPRTVSIVANTQEERDRLFALRLEERDREREDFRRRSMPAWAWAVESTKALRAIRELIWVLWIWVLNPSGEERPFGDARETDRVVSYHLHRVNAEVEQLVGIRHAGAWVQRGDHWETSDGKYHTAPGTADELPIKLKTLPGRARTEEIPGGIRVHIETDDEESDDGDR
jgi:transcriptional regulator with XRE-family HTH domain